MQESRRWMEPRPWKPRVTWGLLVAIGIVFILEIVADASRSGILYREVTWGLKRFLFVISTDWPFRPWTLLTSTLAHDTRTTSHLLFNGIFLYFLGPSVERVMGAKRYIILFLVGGAVSGVLQVHLSAYYLTGQLAPFPPPAGALGASGALMALFGVLIMVMPNEKILLFMVLPAPMWAAGLLYVAMDLLGVLTPGDGIGHFAHLSGMALGLTWGYWLKQDWKRRGLRLVRS